MTSPRTLESRRAIRRSLSITVLLLAASCSSSGSVSPTSVGSSTSSTSTTSTSTTSTSSTTTTELVDPRLLRADGVGGSRFGDPATEVVSTISATLGAPSDDLTESFPNSVEAGVFQDETGEFQYVATIARSVCWGVGFCAVFGGNAPTSLTFTGWRYRNDSTSALRSESAATIGATWAAVPSMTFGSGGCYSVGVGTVDGITVQGESSGEPFGSFDDAGNYVEGVPDPADVRIIGMEAGQLPVFLFGDC